MTEFCAEETALPFDAAPAMPAGYRFELIEGGGGDLALDHATGLLSAAPESLGGVQIRVHAPNGESWIEELTPAPPPFPELDSDEAPASAEGLDESWIDLLVAEAGIAPQRPLPRHFVTLAADAATASAGLAHIASAAGGPDVAPHLWSAALRAAGHAMALSAMPAPASRLALAWAD